MKWLFYLLLNRHVLLFDFFAADWADFLMRTEETFLMPTEQTFFDADWVDFWQYSTSLPIQLSGHCCDNGDDKPKANWLLFLISNGNPKKVFLQAQLACTAQAADTFQSMKVGIQFNEFWWLIKMCHYLRDYVMKWCMHIAYGFWKLHFHSNWRV